MNFNVLGEPFNYFDHRRNTTSTKNNPPRSLLNPFNPFSELIQSVSSTVPTLSELLL